MSITLPKSYFSSKKAKEIAAICEPLVRRYQLTMFVYARVFDDGTSYHLTNHLDYQSYFFEKEFMVSPPVPSHLISDKFSYFLVPGSYQTIYGDTSEKFGLSSPLYLFERYKGFYDMYLFCFKEGKYDAMNLYLNEIQLFEKFKFYFKDKTLKYINDLKENKIILPNTMKPDFMKNNLKIEESQKEFLNQISINRYVLDYGEKTVILTKREFDTVKYLTLGYTVKDIAKQTGLSPRTIDVYINKVKNKFCIHRKSQIVEKILSETNFELLWL